jgi:peptidoglycan/xylan/chitin deacetylase (PgdA/CDA1 family)
MNRITLSFGYDTERPYGRFADSPEGKEFRKNQLDYLFRLKEIARREEISRTYFILGHYMEKCLDDFSLETIREIFDKDDILTDLQQHTYSHPVFREIHGRDKNETVSPESFVEDMKKGHRVVSEILDTDITGLRTPVGYPRDLGDTAVILEGLHRLDYRFVSSDLKTETGWEGMLTRERQPHAYAAAGYPGIFEIPAHGPMDVVFTREKALQFYQREPERGQQILERYLTLFAEAMKLASQTVSISICLCLHPWAAMEYDPDFNIIRSLADAARKKKFGVITYKQVAENTLQQSPGVQTGSTSS